MDIQNSYVWRCYFMDKREMETILVHTEEKPTLDEEEYWLSNGFWAVLDLEYFPEVTFENSPQGVELKLTNQ